MAKVETKIISDILDWPVPAEQKIEVIRSIIEAEAVAPKAEQKPVVKKAAKKAAKQQTKKSTKKAAKKAQSKAGLRSALWQELKKVAPEKVAKLDFRRVNAEQLEALLNDVK